MKRVSKIFLGIWISGLLFSQVVNGLDWPIYLEEWNQHLISGTLGEYRTSHLHAGVDIAEPSGKKVCHVNSTATVDETDSTKIGCKVLTPLNPADAVLTGQAFDRFGLS